MACCYIAASMIAFIIKSCEVLDIDLNLQYNESVTPKGAYSPDDELVSQDKPQVAEESGISVVSVGGMTCAACVSTVESTLAKLPGVSQALVNLALQEARIFHEPGLNIATVVDAIESVGYDAEMGERPAEKKIDTLKQTEELEMLRLALRGIGMSSTVVFVLGKGIELVGLDAPFSYSLLARARSCALLYITATAAIMHGNWILGNSYKAAKSGRANMHTLITTSTTVGLLLSLFDIFAASRSSQYFDTIMGILMIVTVGRYMDLLSRRQAANTFVGLYSMLDETSSVRLASIDKRVPTSYVRAGDEIRIDPYSIIPCDSYVVEGASHANEAIVTGESVPKRKTVGDLLLAGTKNGPNPLRAVVQQERQGSFLLSLIKSIEGSLSAKASVQTRVDAVTQYFVLMVFLVAGCSFYYTFASAADQGTYVALHRGGRQLMTVLAAACPCGLGLATPCAIMAGIDVAWRRGILMLEGAETMEKARSITHVVMDKTGTLTNGVPVVTNMVLGSQWQERQSELAALICAAEEEAVGAHPLASAVFRKLLSLCAGKWEEFQASGGTRELEPSPVGRGIRCEVNIGDGTWHRVAVGSLDYMKHEQVEGLGVINNDMLTQGSVVFASVDGTLAASIILKDDVRPDSKLAIEALQARGLGVSMLTGDNEVEADRISQRLGIRVAAAGVTPEQKLDHIRKLQNGGHKVLMVGDGMNDGPSLAASEIGVMMAHGRKCLSAGGSILVLQSRLQSLVTLLDICDSTIWQVSANIFWALGYNVIALGLAWGLWTPFGITVTPPIAAAMMSFSSVTITLSGVLLRNRLLSRYPDPET